MLCYGQHPQPPSLTSVDLEKLQYSVNQSLAHKCTFVFSGQCPFPKYHFHQVETLKDRPIQERSETSYGKNKWWSLPSHSIATIHNSLWWCSWSSLSIWQPHTTIKVKICESHPSCTVAANVPTHIYTGHSFCIKAATTAVAASMRKLYPVCAGTLDANSDVGKTQHTSSTLGWTPLVGWIYPPPWHSAIFNCHQHLFVCTNYYYVTLIYTYQLTAELQFIACLGVSGLYKE